MNRDLDLGKLALDKGSASSPQWSSDKQRRWISRYVFPASILVGFVALVGAAAGHRLLPTTDVTVVPVVVKRAEQQPEGVSLFQAPGWVEPRPTAVNVPALAAGIIEQMFVVEGEQVALGQPIAKLIDVDAKLAVKQAQAVLAIRQGELDRAIAERDAAQTRYDNPVHLEAQVAEAESMWATAKMELDNLPDRMAKAAAELAFADQSLEGKRSAGAGVSGIVVKRAEADQAASQATLSELQGREPHLERKVAALERQVSALRQQLQLRIEERRQLDEAEAKVKTAMAIRDEAGLALEQAELERERMTVRAPCSGRILRLVSAPGDRVMGLDSTSEHRSSTIAQMYDPARLQVRADVRLEDVPFVVTGQPVKIKTASSRQPMDGRVLLPTSAANVQKNTLEVKVELLDPPPTVTPEMLVTVTFFAPEKGQSQSKSVTQERLFVPEDLLQSGERGTIVWVVGADETAVTRTVETGGRAEDGLVAVRSGLSRTDKLIVSGREQLTEGSRVRILGDDPRLGREANPSREQW